MRPDATPGATVDRVRRWFPARHEVREPHYQPPNLQEQLYRTRLATLRVGERLVRDRWDVRRERVQRLRHPADRTTSKSGHAK